MAKNSKSTVQKSNGSKTNRFHGYSKCMRMQMSRTGLINKYNNAEAYIQSCVSKGTFPDKFMGMFVGRK